MKILNGKGKHKIEQGRETRKKVYCWFLENPNSTKMDCSKALKLSYPCVLRHIKHIQLHDFLSVKEHIDIVGLTNEFIKTLDPKSLQELEEKTIKYSLNSDEFTALNIHKFCLDESIIKKYAKSDEALNCWSDDISLNIQFCFSQMLSYKLEQKEFNEEEYNACFNFSYPEINKRHLQAKQKWGGENE